MKTALGKKNSENLSQGLKKKKRKRKCVNLVFSIDISLHKFREILCVHFPFLQSFNHVNESNTKSFVSVFRIQMTEN